MSGLRIKGLGQEIATLANLPWDKPLEGWPEDEVLTSMRGISRHVVRLIRSNPQKVIVKSLLLKRLLLSLQIVSTHYCGI